MGLGAALFFAPLAAWPQGDPSAPAELVEKTEILLGEVSRLSGLPIRREVPVEFEAPEFFERYYRRRLESQYPPARAAACQKAYEFLGFLAPGQDLIPTYLGSFLGSVAGLYDPDTQTVYLAGGEDPDRLDRVLVHELTHALQDQSFSLKDYFGAEGGQSMDRQFARDSLVEGQAVAVSEDYESLSRDKGLIDASGKTGPQAEGGEEAGPWGPGAVDFPYAYGAAFFRACRKENPGLSLKDLFARPPGTTREILHPGDYGRPVGEPARSGPRDWESDKIWEDELGEYGLFLLARQGEPEGEAWAAVRGWRGDQVRLYEDPQSRRLWLAGWVGMESPSQAGRFYESCRRRLAKKYPTGAARVYWSRSGDQVFWAEGLASAQAADFKRWAGQKNPSRE